MKATNRIIRWAAFLVASVMLTVGMSACGDKNEIEEPDSPETPVTPVTPVNPEDIVTIPASGGTVTRGEITVTFPDGTFTEDTRIAVTKVPEGDVLGQDEVSGFYQLMMPVYNRKPITVRIPCAEISDDIYVVVNLPSISRHLLDVAEYCPVSYETTYTDGAYVATLPASDNADASEEVAISVGLGNRAVFSRGADIGRTRITRAIDGESEGQISWYFETDRNFEARYATQLVTTVDRINSYIHDALKQIDKLGFKLTKAQRRIPITLFKKNKDTAELWGEFKQHYSNDTKSWFAIREDMLTDPSASQQDVKATIFHELLHYFQADYDQRMPFLKYRSCKGDELLMYEAGGQWIEKFVYGHLPDNADNINRYKHFVKGLNDIEAIYADLELAKSDLLGIFDIGKARQSHGYAMSLLWEYLAFELGDKAISELYDEWARKAVTYGWENETTYKTLLSFASTKNSYLFSGGYESFLLQCARGDIAPGFQISFFDTETKEVTTNDRSFEFDGINYPYGADAKDILVRWRSDESLNGKELVIKPLTDDMSTYIYANNGTLLRETPYTHSDSVVIPGLELESHRDGDLIRCHYMLLTTHSPSAVNPKPKNYKISVELRDADVSVSPTELNFGAIGGTQYVHINPGSFHRFGAMVRTEGHGWCGVATAANVTIGITVQPNTTGQRRTCIVDCYVTNEENPTEAQMVKMPVTVTQEADGGDGSYSIDLAKLHVSTRCNIIEIASNGNEYTKELMGGLMWNDYVQDSGLTYTQDNTGRHYSNTYSYTDEWGAVTESTFSFTVGNLANVSNGSKITASNIKSTQRVTKTNTVETYEMSLGSMEMNIVEYSYMNGLYAEGELRGDAVNQAELKYTNYLRGSLWQKYVETIPDDGNSISFVLSIRQNEPETPGFRSPVKPTATSSTTR